MPTEQELQETVHTVRRIDKRLEILDDLVTGDDDRGMPGLVQDMKLVETFIDKWNKREYMIRGAFLLLSSNIVLTLLAIGASFLGG